MLQIFSNDPFPKVICTDCYSNLVIFNEFKNICKNSDALLKKYQINKTESPEVDTSHGTKGNGKCKSIRNSEEMANRIKECAFKKSMTFVESMKSFYFLLNHIEDIESNGGQVIIKNEISQDSLIPTVEINIKNEIIYPNEENQHHQVIMNSVIQHHHQEPAPPEPKRKKRKNNKRKPANGQTTMEIDETGNLVARQIVTTQEQHQQVQQQQQVQAHQSNLQISHQNDNEMALMLTVKQNDNDHSQSHSITVNNQHHTIQPIQIHSSELTKTFLELPLISRSFSDHPLPSLTSTVHHTPTTSSQISIQAAPQTVTTTIMPQIQYSCSSCNEIFNNTDTLRQHLFHSHQILFPFSPATATEQQYQVQLPQTSLAATIQPVTQQYTFTHPHKKYFDSEFPCLLCGVISKNQDDLIKHMIRHTTQAGTSTSSGNQPTIIERERVNDPSSTPTDLSNSTQYK